MLTLTFSLYLIILLIVIYCCKNWNNFKKYLWVRKQIDNLPGKDYHPILGHIKDILGTPEEIFLNTRKNVKPYLKYGAGKVFIFHTPSVLMFGPEDAETLLANPIHNKKSYMYNLIKPWLGTGLLISDGEMWQFRRKLLTPTFHFNILIKFLNVFNEKTDDLINEFKELDGKEVDIVKYISHFTLSSVVETAMGTSIKSLININHYINAVLEICLIISHRICHPWLLIDFIFSFTKKYWEQRNHLKCLHDFANAIIQEKKDIIMKLHERNEEDAFIANKKTLGFLDLLLMAQLRGANIDDKGIRDEVDTFMFEGHDTTSACICFTLMMLACNPDCQQRVYDEIISIIGDTKHPSYQQLAELKYTEMSIKESLRLYPSVPLISRTCGEDMRTHHGGLIPKGTTVSLLIYDLHRREDLYPNPEKFDPERFLPENIANRHPFAYIPFSAGSRNCIGQKFAMLEIKCVLSGLIRNFKLEPVDNPNTLTLFEDLILRSKNGIKIKFVSR